MQSMLQVITILVVSLTVLIGLVVPGSFCLRKSFLLGEGSFRHRKALRWLILGCTCLGLAVVLLDLIWLFFISPSIIDIQVIGPSQSSVLDPFSEWVHNLTQAACSNAAIGGILSCLLAFIFAKVGIRQLTVYGTVALGRLLAVICLIIAVISLSEVFWSLGDILNFMANGWTTLSYAPLSRLVSLLFLYSLQSIAIQYGPYFLVLLGVALVGVGIVLYKQYIQATKLGQTIKSALLEFALACTCAVLILGFGWYFRV